MKKFIGISAFASIALTNTVQAAGDIEAGRMLSTQCSACHGNDGMSNSEQWPNLAGQKESYLAAQLNKYRTGDRSDPTMSAIVGPLSDGNVNDLAAYYAAQTAVASFAFDTQILSIPYVEVGDSTFNVEMSLDNADGLIFSVKTLTER